jgi:quercetin dioxygenase-like cupin family protein
MARRTLVSLVGILLLVAGFALGESGLTENLLHLPALAASPAASPAETAPATTIREILATGQPAGAPGQTLDLVRYTIPAATTLAVHVHPGMQVAWVASGALTYHVLKGQVQIGRAANASAGNPGPTETLSAGESTVLLPGDWVVEVPDAVHYGQNLGTEPLILWATTLLTTGAPAAIPVNDEGTPVA